jgi:predicted GNAT family N-acyltransferase
LSKKAEDQYLKGPGDPEFIEVITDEQKQAEMGIRQVVFVEEQNVDPGIEYDEFEDSSIHYILISSGKPVGCARFRWVGPDIKLERLAVLKTERGNGYGSLIMERILQIVSSLCPRKVYLHSQCSAKGFYERFGFETSGHIFQEAEIDHVRMQLRRGDIRNGGS